jgi:hypothetical protein
VDWLHNIERTDEIPGSYNKPVLCPCSILAEINDVENLLLERNKTTRLVVNKGGKLDYH